MKNSELIEFLSEYAEALIEGKSSPQILAEHQMEDNNELASLLQLAEEVKSVLKPVPVPAFRENLRQRLEAYEPSNVTISSSSSGRKQKILFVAMAGSTLSAVGLFVILFRRLRSPRDDLIQPITSVA